MAVTMPGRPLTRLDRNECTSLLPGVAEAIRGDVDGWHCYPDPDAWLLTEMLAAKLRLHPDEIVVGPGSAELLERVLRTCVGGTRGQVVYAAPAFEAYADLVRRAGAVPVAVAHGATNIDALLAAVTPSTRAVIVCNPHNPTGAALTAADLDYLLANVGRNVLVVVDEAYKEFVADVANADSPDGVGFVARGHDQVVVTRTFSKAHGLAGLRVGYLAARPALARVLRRAGLPFHVSAPAQIAAAASLRADSTLESRCSWIRGERERVRHALHAAGFLQVPRSHANFVWIPLPSAAEAFVSHCADSGFAVRGYPGYGVRISLAAPADNAEFIRVAARARMIEQVDRCVTNSNTAMA
ncbi:pyridoxal phosphate-dependent aminotransferase [Saccharopolyspora elongata]|uniref:Aminotransferase class I/II-fold pyridoxal phosphate-dependent enzyme n=1 Tax=Saccharopolyspora elongata TaxID=2530387 RepID=A0A4R4Y2T5_9PSEU|nr:aminotransferase class I/II-fold pyridoxal phosphate-dependent enzyme [Saccharopolyspora elongata]TDD37779.1 aminotransferase class I/II-fold pyridoxal phosphate-dependent enzyme [Saccharopolyspora elongata]